MPRVWPQEVVCQGKGWLSRVRILRVETGVHGDDVNVSSHWQVSRERTDIGSIDDCVPDTMLNAEAEVHRGRRLGIAVQGSDGGWPQRAAALGIRVEIAIVQRRSVGNRRVANGRISRIAGNPVQIFAESAAQGCLAVA